MSPSRPRRWLFAAVGILMASAPALATAVPAQASAVHNYPVGKATLQCGAPGDQFTGAAWVYEMSNSPASNTPMHFVVELDGKNIYDIMLAPANGIVSMHTVEDDLPTTIVAHADGQLVFSETGTPDCEPPPVTTVDITFDCTADGGVVTYGFLTSGVATPTLFTGTNPDGTATTWTFNSEGNNFAHRSVAEDTDFATSVSYQGVEISSLSGHADCEPPPTTPDPGDDTSSQSDGPPAAGPPTTDPPAAAPPAEVLSSQAVPAAATLPRTGSSTGPLAAVGAGSVLLGLGLVTIAKRRMSLR